MIKELKNIIESLEITGATKIEFSKEFIQEIICELEGVNEVTSDDVISISQKANPYKIQFDNESETHVKVLEDSQPPGDRQRPGGLPRLSPHVSLTWLSSLCCSRPPFVHKCRQDKI